MLMLKRFFQSIGSRFREIQWRSWQIITVGIVIVAVVVAGFFVVRGRSTAQSGGRPTGQAGQTGTGTGIQTAMVRRGSLELTASGDGTLTSDTYDLSFTSGGLITNVYVKVGDTVEAGDLLAQVEDTDAQISYTEAQRSLLELKSVTAVATAQQNLATAQADLITAKESYEYMVSPNVYYWENKVDEAKKALAKAQTAADAAPNDKDAQKKLEDAQYTLNYANDSLTGAWEAWDKYYVPETFTSRKYDALTKSNIKYVNKPTEAQISEARAAIVQAQDTVDQAQNLYTYLTGGDLPKDAIGDGITQIESAQLALDSAKKVLDGTRIYAPLAGMVSAVNSTVGDTVDSGATVITMVEPKNPYLEIYLDESDWGNVSVGDKATVTFDLLKDRTYNGTVTHIDPNLDTSSSSPAVRVLIKLDNSGDTFKLPLGTHASAEIIGGSAQNAVLVPAEALHTSDGSNYTVYVMQNGQPKEQAVEIGISNAQYAEVKFGLKAGDMVVTGNLPSN
jgi:RND family efflux transporter MFP subunit